MKHKWTLFTFSRGDFKTLEQYLNEQAQKGWELEKTGVLARWKKTERRDLTYCVDLAKPRQDHKARREYADLCAEGGWELAAFTGQMYIFKSRPGERSVPIQTDPELERRQYNRYYIWNTILSVVVLVAYFGFLFGVGAALGSDFWEAVDGLRYQALYSWTFAFLRGAMPLLGLWALWKIVDFIRAAIKGRTGTMGRSPCWVMWLNNILAFAAGAGAAIVLAGCVLETLLGDDFESYLFILLLTWGGAMLYRALEIERELFPRERRRYVAVGVVCLLCFALLIVGRVTLKAGNWSTSDFSMDSEKGMAVYGQTHALPLIHGEDVGVPFLPEEGETVHIYHEVIPAGERWEVNYMYGSKKSSHGFLNVGSETTQCFTEKQAELLAEALVQGYGLNRYAPWPDEGLTAVEIGWADEAWYGTVIPKDGEVISVLAIRVGERVTRMIYPADLMSVENLEIIRAELGR